MPYISSSGVPSPIGTDAFAPTTNLKSIVDGEAVYDYFITVAADSDRTSLATPALREGLHCFVLATHLLWRYDTATWTQLSNYRSEGWEPFTAASFVGATTFGATHNFGALPFDTTVELEFMGVADANSAPSTRTVIANFVVTGTGVTLTESCQEAVTIGSGSVKGPVVQLSTLDIPAATAATAKLQITPSAVMRMSAGSWRWRRVSA